MKMFFLVITKNSNSEILVRLLLKYGMELRMKNYDIKKLWEITGKIRLLGRCMKNQYIWDKLPKKGWGGGLDSLQI